MVDVITGLYDFILPEEGGSDDTWGSKLNSNWAKMETLLAGAFAGGTPTSLGASLRLNAGGASSLTDINPINPLDASAQILRIGRSSPVGNLSVVLYNPGTTTARVTLDSAGVGKVTAGEAAFGAFLINNTAGIFERTSGAIFYKVPDAANHYFRIGTVDAAMVEPAGTAITDAQAIVTLEKGDFRYLQLAGGAPTGPIDAGVNRIAGALTHNIGAGYFYFGSYQIATYGDGSLRGFWNHNTGVLNLAGINTVGGGSIVPGISAGNWQLTPAGQGIFTSVKIGSFDINVAAGLIERLTGSLVFNVPTGFIHTFQINSVAAARVELAGTGVPQTFSIITREKGDDRYVKQAGAANEIGTLGFMKVTSGSANPGNTLAASSLKYSNTVLSESATTVSGTWMALGSGNLNTATLFQRIS